MKAEKESFLITITYERDDNRVKQLAEQLCEQGHVVHVVKDRYLYEPSTPEKEAEKIGEAKEK